MKTKDAKLLLKDLTATLEDEQWQERNLSILYGHTSGGKTPHELIVSGRESGLAKAIRIVKGGLKVGEPQNGDEQPSKRNPMSERRLPWMRSENGK